MLTLAEASAAERIVAILLTVSPARRADVLEVAVRAIHARPDGRREPRGTTPAADEPTAKIAIRLKPPEPPPIRKPRPDSEPGTGS